MPARQRSRVQAGDCRQLLCLSCQIKSFGSERKEELSKAGHQKLIEKHGELFHNKLEKTKTNPALNQIRAQINSYIQTIVQNTSPYDLKILFLLPVKGGGGGAHSVIQEVIAMKSLNVDVQIAVNAEHLDDFQDKYSDLGQQRFNEILSVMTLINLNN